MESNKHDILLQTHKNKIEYLKDADTDPIQSRWFKKKPLYVNHMRAPKDTQAKDRDFILVQKENVDEHRSEFFINLEITKFQRFQREQELKQQQPTLHKEDYRRIIIQEELRELDPDLFNKGTERDISEHINKVILEEDKQRQDILDRRSQRLEEEKLQQKKKAQQKK